MKSPFTRRMSRDGTATIEVQGEVDFTNADEVAGGIRAAVTQWSPATVRVDLRTATFIDSTGLGALLSGYRAAAERGVRFVVVNPSIAVRRVLTVTGLSGLFGLTAHGPLDRAAPSPGTALLRERF